ncbi:hypothetical protein L367_03025 [Klebsiella pneumoniae MGH 21]|nr:hypothetical protein L367_03025 [Klebsiella pneumoniae MGH 21]SXZ94166.1 Uncharacterised protein [Klebsiella pneumoniae]SYA20143.1 Uncharacterised protein [Klebsiella pneumoniae]
MVALHRHRLSHPHLLLTRQNQKAISHSMALKVTSLRTIIQLMVISQQTSLMTKSRSQKARRRNTNSSQLKARSLILQRWSNSSLSRVS